MLNELFYSNKKIPTRKIKDFPSCVHFVQQPTIMAGKHGFVKNSMYLSQIDGIFEHVQKSLISDILGENPDCKGKIQTS